MDNLKEKVLSNLRAVTQSIKGGVPLAHLERDYRCVLGTSIPYRDLNYPTLEAFIRDIPDVISVSRSNTGELVAQGVADANTAHLASLVSRQVVSRKKPSKKHFVRRGGYVSRYASSSRGGRSYHSSSSSSYAPSRTKAYSSSSSTYSRQIYQPPAARSRTPPNERYAPRKPSHPPAATQNRKNYKLPPRFQRQQSQQHDSSRTPSPPIEPVIQSTKVATPIQASLPSFESDYGRRTVQSTASENFANEDFAIPLMQPKPLQITVDHTRVVRDNLLGELDATESAMKYVETYCRANNIEPEYVVKKIGQKKKNQTYVCLLIIAGKKYQSYPEEANSEKEASEIAAANAVEELKKNREKLCILPKTNVSTPEEIKLLRNRIEEIVLEKPTGMFERGIEEEYVNIYEESLPKEWTDIIKQSGILEIEEVSVSYGSLPSGVQLIIRPAKGASSGSTTPSETSSRANSDLRDSHPNFSNLSSPASDAPEFAFPEVPQLELPVGNEWAISVISAVENIAARILDYDEDFCELSNKMSIFYESHHLPVEKVCRKQLLATTDIKNKSMIHRVLVSKIISADKAVCYYVDEGVYAEVQIPNLQELHRDFYKLPYQAIQIALEDMEEYEPFLKPEYMDFQIKPLIAVVKKCYKPATDFLPNDPSITKMVYSVVLYDTEVPEGEEEICVNDAVKQKALRSLECRLPKIGVSAQGYMTHVNEKGEMYLRFLPPVNGWLEMKLQQLSTGFEAACSEGQSSLNGKMCAAKFDDDLWYRAVIPEISTLNPSQDELEVFFIDYGHPGLVKKKDICDLEPHSEFLAMLGNQAIKCELYNALPTPASTWTNAALHKLMEYAAFNEQLIIKVARDQSDSSAAKVILYKRIETNDESFIISINENIANRAELFESTASNSVAETPTTPSPYENGKSLDLPINFQKMNIATSTSNDGLKWMMTPDVKSPDGLAFEDLSTKPLCLPRIPDVGKYWNVFVTIAPHPHNFTVQPYDSASQVDDLRVQMKQFYSLEENVIEVEMSLLKVNDFYAAFHSDNEWYRARILTIENSERVTCHFVDFGDYYQISIHRLQILYSQFRTLPCQAIKASLAGIKPVGIDWDPLHCVAYSDMVTEKPFVSILKQVSVENDRGFAMLKVELVLLDTSKEEEMCINEVLVKKGMAKS